MAELPFLRDLVVLLLLSLGIVLVFQRLRQPSIVGFLAAGVVLGPPRLSLVREGRPGELLAQGGGILLPLLAPGVASAGLLAFLFSWNEFLFAYTFTATGASRTVPVALALFPGVFEVPWGDIAAASMLASLPPVLIVVGLQRYLVRGLLAGAVKD